MRKRRMDLGITQKEAARRIGAGQFTVINWEKSRTQTAVRFVPAVIQFLGYDPFPEGQTLGERLRAARWRRGLSHTALARELEVDPCTILSWERGRHRPPVTYWPRILELVGSEEIPNDAPLPDRLRAYRRAHGLTLAKLGAILGVSQNVVWHWEQGRRLPDTLGPGFVKRLRELLES